MCRDSRPSPSATFNGLGQFWYTWEPYAYSALLQTKPLATNLEDARAILAAAKAGAIDGEESDGRARAQVPDASLERIWEAILDAGEVGEP